MKPPWDHVEHVADLALRVHGRGLGEIFVNAAHAMFAQIDPRGAEQSTAPVERQVRVQGMDPESLLVNWLNELLYLHETRREVYSEFRLRTLHCPPVRGATAQLEGACDVGGRGLAAVGRESAETLCPPGVHHDTVHDAEWCEGLDQARGRRPEASGDQEPCELSASIRGAPSSEVQQIIKAATFHGLQIQCDSKGCVATVVFDV